MLPQNQWDGCRSLYLHKRQVSVSVTHKKTGKTGPKLDHIVKVIKAVLCGGLYVYRALGHKSDHLDSKIRYCLMGRKLKTYLHLRRWKPAQSAANQKIRWIHLFGFSG